MTCYNVCLMRCIMRCNKTLEYRLRVKCLRNKHADDNVHAFQLIKSCFV